MGNDRTALAITFSIIELLTAIVSVFRLAFRLRIRRLWWEDFWAAIVMVVAVAFAIVTLIYLPANNFGAARFFTWFTSYAYTSIVWSVRMSLLYSIVRVMSPSSCLRNFMRIIGALFLIVWASLIALKAWWCVHNVKFKSGRLVCRLSSSIAIYEVAVDFAGDATLVILSLRLLWRVKLPRRQRRMILLIFSSSAIMSVISLPHAIAQVLVNGYLQYILVNLELISSLVVCNLLVVVTYIYRVYRSSSDSQSETSSEDDDFTTPMPRSPLPLTTVDLNTLDPTNTGTTDCSRSSYVPSSVRSAAT